MARSNNQGICNFLEGSILFALEASDIMKSIGEAIQFLHAVNIAHRDVKVCITALGVCL